jgi:opacity protein-like surface antigen
MLQTEAQNSKKNFIGVQIGATHSTISNDRENDFLIQSDWKTNFSLGVSYLHIFNDKIGIEAKLNYINIGTSYEDISGDGINDGGQVNFSTDVKYINFPITVLIYPFKTKYFHFTGGFYFSRLISAEQNGDLNEYNDDFITINIERDLTEQTRNLDFGFTAGIGSKINLNDKMNLGLELKYNYSLIDLNKNFTNDDVKYNNKFITAEIGLYYSID